MKQTKHLLLLLLAFMLSVTETFAQAVGTDFTVGNIKYIVTAMDLTTHNNTAAVSYIGGTGAVTVPPSVVHPKNKETVYITESKEYTNCADGVTSITFSEGYTTMGKGCYAKSKNLTKVTFPKSFTTMNPGCFEANNKLTSFEVVSGNTKFSTNSDGWLLADGGTTLQAYPTGLSGDVTIPNTITKITPTAFNVCASLGKVTIPASVTSIASGITASFLAVGTYFEVDDSNPNYKSVGGVLFNKDVSELITFPKDYSGSLPSGKYTVPSTVKTIAGEAFSHTSTVLKAIDLSNTETISAQAFDYTSGLEKVTIGPKVNSIEDGAFLNCEKITEYIVDVNNASYSSDEGIIYSKDKKTLYLCPIAKTGSYEIPEGTVTVKAKAFYSSKLSSIKFPSTLTAVEDQAFRFSSISNLDFGTNSNLSSIGSSAFGNTQLTGSLTLPASVANLGSGAFNYTKLKDVHIADGSKLEAITFQAFGNMPELETFIFDGSANHLKRLDEQAFANAPKLKRFDVPASVTKIGKGAFLNTTALETVTFQSPSKIKEIKEGAFGSSGIKYINLPNSVETIQQQAFDNCTNLTTITNPASVTNIGIGVFNFCENLTTINVDAANTKYSSLSGMLTNKDKTELVVFPAGKANSKYALIPNIATVKPYAFYGSEKITNITFPKTVTSIGDRAIALCDKLKSLSFMGEDNVPVLSADIMYQSSNLRDVTIYVRKKWYENSANDAAVNTYNSRFKEVHPSFVSETGYDRGTEFFPTSATNVGVISFYTPRTSVIIDNTAKESDYTDVRGKHWTATTYDVSSILDYAYQNETTVKDIVVLSNIGIVGLNAFKAGNQLQGIYFVSNTPAQLNSTDYGMNATDYPFNANQNIYVKRSKVNDYKTVWEVDGHTLNITAEIPQTTHSYGATRCYPFDVQYDNNGDVRPYLPVDFSHMTAANPYAKARRIDDGYVPAFLGVLLHSRNAASATSYCEMTDTQDHHAVNDPSGKYSAATYKMVGVVEDTQVMSDANNNLYAFSKSKGQFLKIKQAPGNMMPRFSAYLKLDSSNQAKGFSFRFDDDDPSTTGIENIEIAEDANDSAPYYNLNGMRVNNPAKGVYIHNGKKVIIK